MTTLIELDPIERCERNFFIDGVDLSLELELYTVNNRFYFLIAAGIIEGNRNVIVFEIEKPLSKVAVPPKGRAQKKWALELMGATNGTKKMILTEGLQNGYDRRSYDNLFSFFNGVIQCLKVKVMGKVVYVDGFSDEYDLFELPVD